MYGFWTLCVKSLPVGLQTASVGLVVACLFSDDDGVIIDRKIIYTSIVRTKAICLNTLYIGVCFQFN